MKYRLIPKSKKNLNETAASLQPPASSIKDSKKQINENIDLDNLEKFTGPKEAIRWCNKKFEELGDIKFKQIANYLHIYL